LINTFIPYTFELIIDKNAEVGQSATEALVKIASLIKKEHIEPQLLSVIVNLAHDDRVEEYRIAAAKLFNGILTIASFDPLELAPVFGEKLCREVVVQEIISLSDDPSLLVRKTVSQHLGKICKIIGTEATVTKILPVFMNLSKVCHFTHLN
jgi:serine/threonine-protein phosphatase 4 regulatory subunit 1